MFNVGSTEFIVILFVALMLFGAKRVPELARSVGKGVRDFKQAMSGIETELRKEVDLDGELRRPTPILRPEPAAQPRGQLAPPPEVVLGQAAAEAGARSTSTTAGAPVPGAPAPSTDSPFPGRPAPAANQDTPAQPASTGTPGPRARTAAPSAEQGKLADFRKSETPSLRDPGVRDPRTESGHAPE